MRNVLEASGHNYCMFLWIFKFTTRDAQISLGKSYYYTTNFDVDGIYFEL